MVTFFSRVRLGPVAPGSASMPASIAITTLSPASVADARRKRTVLLLVTVRRSSEDLNDYGPNSVGRGALQPVSGDDAVARATFTVK